MPVSSPSRISPHPPKGFSFADAVVSCFALFVPTDAVDSERFFAFTSILRLCSTLTMNCRGRSQNVAVEKRMLTKNSRDSHVWCFERVFDSFWTQCFCGKEFSHFRSVSPGGLGLKDSEPFHEIDLTFGGSTPEEHNPIASHSSHGQLNIFLHPYFSSSAVSLSPCGNEHFSSNLQFGHI